MERWAWLVMTAGLVGFAGLLALAVYGVRAAVEYVEAPTVVEEVSGILLYRPAEGAGQESVSSGTEIYQGDRVQVPAGSTARLQVADGSRVDLFANASVRLDEARSPRLTGRRSEFQLRIDHGTAGIAVSPATPDTRSFQVLTPHGLARLDQGEYTVRVAADATRVSVWDGRASVQVGSDVLEVTAGRKIVLNPDGSSNRVEVLENVILNGSFANRLTAWDPWEQNEAREDARGQLLIVAPTEPNAPGTALRIQRESLVQAHNETGVTQILKTDVTGSRAVKLQMWLKVDHASLSGGGYLGTEYPLMLRVRYQTPRGNEEVWTRGFYYANPEQRPTPNSELIERGVWTRWEADLTKLPGGAAVIQHVQILGAGHTFDSSVGDVRLLVD